MGSLIKATPHDRFFLIPGNYNMMLAEQALNPVKGREYRLDLIIEATGGAFTDIVIDCPPNLGILTDNALYAARSERGGLVIPVQAEQTSMPALDLLLDQVESIERGLRIKVTKLAIVLNLVQPSKWPRAFWHTCEQVLMLPCPSISLNVLSCKRPMERVSQSSLMSQKTGARSMM